MPTPEDLFLSCDWGTTSFRLRLVSDHGQTIAGELSEATGVKAMISRIPEAQRADGAERARVYSEFFLGKVVELKRRWPWSGEIPAVISGMASSTVGWRELPYASLPFPLSGSGLVHQRLEFEAGSGISYAVLVSGLASGNDILRGEETEIIGLHAGGVLKDAERSLNEMVVILPGTHSKRIQIRNGDIVDFQTFMTGELFEVLATQSLLKMSVQWPITGEEWIGVSMKSRERQAFVEGVKWVRQYGLARSMFRVRTRSVLDGCAPAENSWFLSGLLIGAEIADLQGEGRNVPIYLAGSGKFVAPYQTALEQLDFGGRLRVIPEAAIRMAPARAHARLLSGMSRLRRDKK